MLINWWGCSSNENCLIWRGAGGGGLIWMGFLGEKVFHHPPPPHLLPCDVMHRVKFPTFFKMDIANELSTRKLVLSLPVMPLPSPPPPPPHHHHSFSEPPLLTQLVRNMETSKILNPCVRISCDQFTIGIFIELKTVTLTIGIFIELKTVTLTIGIFIELKTVTLMNIATKPNIFFKIIGRHYFDMKYSLADFLPISSDWCSLTSSLSAFSIDGKR